MAGGWATRAAPAGMAGVACLVLAALPLFLPPFELELVSAALVLGLLAASVAVMAGYAGAISIGHGAFYGVGAFAAAQVFIHLTSSALAGVVLGAVGGAVLGAVFGLLAGRVRGGYLVMLTIALVEVVGTAAESFPELTGGADGLVVPPAALGGAVLSGPVGRYWTVLAAAVVAVAVLSAILRSPLGRAISAMRQSEPRMACSGYNVLALKVTAWTISGALAGYAGSLLVVNSSFVSTHEASFATSAIAILVVCIGGVRSIPGVFTAALLVVLVRDHLSALLVGRSQLLLGALFVLFAYAFPAGISVGEIRRRLSWGVAWKR